MKKVTKREKQTEKETEADQGLPTQKQQTGSKCPTELDWQPEFGPFSYTWLRMGSRNAAVLPEPDDTNKLHR